MTICNETSLSHESESGIGGRDAGDARVGDNKASEGPWTGVECAFSEGSDTSREPATSCASRCCLPNELGRMLYSATDRESVARGGVGAGAGQEDTEEDDGEGEIGRPSTKLVQELTRRSVPVRLSVLR